MNWIETNNYIEGDYSQFEYKNKVAGFDLDWTLINTKSKQIFPIDKDDWIVPKAILNKLRELHNNDYCIVIISNQKTLKKSTKIKTQWLTKIENIGKYIKIPFKIFASLNSDIYRKPMMTFWRMVESHIQVDKQASFFCGDACGRLTDHGDTDLKFALNNNLTFYTPEEITNKEKHISRTIKYPINFNDIQSNQLLITTKTDSSNMQLTEDTIFKHIPYKKVMFLMVGFPACGKSTFVQKYLTPHNVHRINMDTLKTKPKCISECKSAIQQQKKIVIDNTNVAIENRKLYINMAIKANYKVVCITVNTNLIQCQHNSLYRAFTKHERIVPKVVYNTMKKKYTEPKLTEGYECIINVTMEHPKSDDYSKYYIEKIN